MELYCTPKSQYTTVKHSQKLFEHTYASDLYGPGALIPIGFFQQDLLWQSSNTHSHSCSQKASKHPRSIRRRAIGPLAHHNGTSAYSPSLTCTSPDDRMSSSSTVLTRVLLSRNFPIRTQSSNRKESAAKYTRQHPTDLQTRLLYQLKFRIQPIPYPKKCLSTVASVTMLLVYIVIRQWRFRPSSIVA
jgi:hypothetical protein